MLCEAEKLNRFKDHSPWLVYVLRCSDGSYYVGVANDVAHRLRQHNAGQAVAFTKKRRPVEFVYVEECGSHLSARRRERQLKGWRREKKEMLINGFPSAPPV
ncbi:MAG: GIY-YIG nuclease family protein [candidate division Zixibacteria bacterium]|nr:GIY-YIG nuclease family protein [candidate division Zixibacteria bacterium]MCI0596455.1 GIY-YIG nuclease family protein [candidate division Zixibacteria bacterium]